MRLIRTFLLIAVSLSLMAQAEKPPKGSAPKLDLGVPEFKSIPKDQKLEGPAVKNEPQLMPSTPTDLTYSVVRVVHSKGFLRGPDGAKPAFPLSQITVSGTPLVTERFATVVRAKCTAKRNSRIDVSIVGPRNETLMEASGDLIFGKKNDEAEWQVDWESTSVRNPGTFQVLVRIGGNPVGSFPLEFVRPPN